MKTEEKIEGADENVLTDYLKKSREKATKPLISELLTLEMSTSYNIDTDIWSDLNTLLTSSFIKNFHLSLRITMSCVHFYVLVGKLSARLI